MAAEPWCLDNVRVAGTEVHVTGWAIPVAGRPGRGTITFNGVAAATREFGIVRNDIGSVYGYAPNAHLSGFAAQGAFDPQARHVQIDYVDTVSALPVCAHHSFFLPLMPEALPIPDATHRTRTMGVVDDFTFRLSGYTLARKIDTALRQIAGHGFAGFTSVLDWGAGCGRLSRYILPALDPQAALTMADIDADNVGWCAANIPDATAVVLPLLPPCSLPADRFDLIIGNSIFTHLQEQVQFAWLRELCRIASSGAYILVTVHSIKDMLRATASEPAYDTLFATGFVDEFPDTALAGNISDDDYYRATFHTHEYIYRNWSPILTVERIIPDFGNNHQDLVVLRKP